MSILKLTIEGINAEELLSNLIATANAMSVGADLSLVANETGKKAVDEKAKKDVAAADEPKPDAPENTEKDVKPTGRRGGRKQQESAGEDPAPTGRRSRSNEKKNLVNDNEEQAALRAQLILDLQDLADVEEAHGEVADALSRVGSKTVKDIPSDLLGDFNVDIQKLINAYFE